MHTHLRRAVTLVELLVIIGIIGILIGILIAAVQNVRAAAGRTQCQNQMRQLGLALHQYHDSQKAFPIGCSYLNGNHPQPHMSFLTRMLPYLEQNTLWQQSVEAFQKEKFFRKDPHFAIRTYRLRIFVCPMDARAAGLQMNLNREGYTSYLGVTGQDYRTKDGLFFVDSNLTMADVRDGLSNTLAIGERPPNLEGNLGWWYAGWGQQKDGSAEYLLGVREMRAPDVVVGCPRGPYEFKSTDINDRCNVFHFWSFHSGGANFIYADGSVHFIRYSGNSILPAIASRAGGEIFEKI